MLKNYFKLAIRNLQKSKLHSFINIAGLSAGMAVAMLIGLWIRNEVSHNKYHTNYDRIAKLRQHVNVNGDIHTEKTVPYPLAQELRNNYGSYFKYVVMSSHRADHVLSFGEKNINQNGIYFEPEAPEMLTLHMLSGTRGGLKDPSSIMLSASAVKACFGDMDPSNQVIRIDNKMQVRVTGVYEDLPSNSTFAGLDFIAPFGLYVNNAPWIKSLQDSWSKNPIQAYVQLTDGADMEEVSATIRNIRLSKLSKDEAKFNPALFLDPMPKWYLYAEYKNGVNAGGKIKYVWMFGIIGAFVLLLACINFMNLSTARSQKRAKEVGIRKVAGSLRGQLITQFFCESLLVSVFAFAFSLLLVQLILPFFNGIANKEISILWSNPAFWLMGIGFSVMTGLIAGSYPAFYLSSFQPIKVLKGSFKVGNPAAIPRKVLVVFQFTISVSLIICTIVVFRQIEFAKDRPIGYSKDGLVAVPLVAQDDRAYFELLRNELLKTGAIADMAGSESTTTNTWGTQSMLDWKDKDPNLAVDFPVTGISVDYGKTVGWQFLQGRDFSRQFASDSSGFILNEAAVKFMGLKGPLRETINWKGKSFSITGVIKDVIVESPYEAVKPSLYWMHPWQANFAIIKINPRISASEALEKIEAVFKKYTPAVPFDYKFADEEYARKFGNEVRTGKLANFFAILAIFISCLGLFGMASFMAEQRTKEIGVRKVLGASVFNLWLLLSKDFVSLVLISLLIAAPLAYYFMHSWLQNYEYRTEISWWIFAAAGVGAVLITLVTVSYQSIKAALVNPVRSLRSE